MERTTVVEKVKSMHIERLNLPVLNKDLTEDTQILVLEIKA